jgi:hypothetical protein
MFVPTVAAGSGGKGTDETRWCARSLQLLFVAEAAARLLVVMSTMNAFMSCNRPLFSLAFLRIQSARLAAFGRAGRVEARSKPFATIASKPQHQLRFTANSRCSGGYSRTMVACPAPNIRFVLIFSLLFSLLF